MPKILDDQLFTTLQEYEQIKSERLKLEKQEKKLREELDMKLGDYDDSEIEVGNFSHAPCISILGEECTFGEHYHETDDPIYLVKYTPQETRKIVREKLIEKGVSIKVLLYATEVTQSRRLSFRRS